MLYDLITEYLEGTDVHKAINANFYIWLPYTAAELHLGGLKPKWDHICSETYIVLSYKHCLLVLLVPE